MHYFNRRQFSKILTGRGIALATGQNAWANDAPMRIVVHFAPGGGDVLGRLFAEKMAPLLERVIIVENKPGGSTTMWIQLVNATQ